jgi:hypothetical protein
VFGNILLEGIWGQVICPSFKMIHASDQDVKEILKKFKVAAINELLRLQRLIGSSGTVNLSPRPMLCKNAPYVFRKVHFVYGLSHYAIHKIAQRLSKLISD